MAEPESGLADPGLDRLEIAMPAHFEHVGNANFEGIKLVGTGELQFEDGARQPALRGDRAGLDAFQGGEFKEAARRARDQFVLFVLEGDFQFAESNVADGGNVPRLETIRADDPQRLEGGGSAVRGAISIGT